MDNVAVFVDEGDGNPNLLGLYEGIPLTTARELRARDRDARPHHDLPHADPVRCATEAEVVDRCGSPWSTRSATTSASTTAASTSSATGEAPP